MGYPPATGTLFKCMGLLNHFCCFNCVPGNTGLGNSLHFSLQTPGSPGAELPGESLPQEEASAACSP